MTRGVGHRGSVDGLLPVACWCQRRIVKATPQDIRAGRSKSCGKPCCDEIGADILRGTDVTSEALPAPTHWPTW